MKSPFAAVPHNVFRELARHDGLGAEARVLMAIMGATFAFQRDGGEAAISYAELAARAGMPTSTDGRFYVLRKIVNRLAEKDVISVRGSTESKTSRRVYRVLPMHPAVQNSRQSPMHPAVQSEGTAGYTTGNPAVQSGNAPHGADTRRRDGRTVRRTSQEAPGKPVRLTALQDEESRARAELRALLDEAVRVGHPVAASWRVGVEARLAGNGQPKPEPARSILDSVGVNIRTALEAYR